MNSKIISLVMTISLAAYSANPNSEISTAQNESVCTKSISAQDLEQVIKNCSLETLARLSVLNSGINTDITNINRQIALLEESIAKGEIKRETLTFNTSNAFVSGALVSGILGVVVSAGGLININANYQVMMRQSFGDPATFERQNRIPIRGYTALAGLSAAAIIYAVYEMNIAGSLDRKITVQKSQVFDFKKQLQIMQQSLSIVETAKLIAESQPK